MDQAHLLASHIAHETLSRLEVWIDKEIACVRSVHFSRIAKESQPERLVWMCERIEKKSERWPSTKLHRWIGHIHGCALALGIFTFNDLKDIVSEAKKHFPRSE